MLTEAANQSKQPATTTTTLSYLKQTKQSRQAETKKQTAFLQPWDDPKTLNDNFKTRQTFAWREIVYGGDRSRFVSTSVRLSCQFYAQLSFFPCATGRVRHAEHGKEAICEGRAHGDRAADLVETEQESESGSRGVYAGWTSRSFHPRFQARLFRAQLGTTWNKLNNLTWNSLKHPTTTCNNNQEQLETN